MKIVVFGASGQIGHGLAVHLSAIGHHVTAVLRSHATQAFPAGIDVVKREAFDEQTFESLLQGADHAVHAIGLPEQFRADVADFHAVNCRLFEVFLAALRRVGGVGLTYVSSYEVFAPRDGRIEETNGMANPDAFGPYSRSKIAAFQHFKRFAEESGRIATSIHPAAVYGGLATSDGLTSYIERLAKWKWHQAPVIHPGRFPVVHVSSLADLVGRALGKSGSYIASDAMTTLKEIAVEVRGIADGYVPPEIPVGLVKLGVVFMEPVAKLTGTRPLSASGQVEFLTRGTEPSAVKAVSKLGWRPMPLAAGLRAFLEPAPVTAAA